MNYLDNAATTKVSLEVFNEMLPLFIDEFYNASSTYNKSKIINEKIKVAREHCANLIGAEKEEIIFTSGSTESINYALKGYLEENFDKGNHIITTKTEHKAILATLEYLESRGVDVTYLDVNMDGLIDLDKLRNSILPTTSLISIMLVNNETGVIQNLKEIGTIARLHDIKFFCDATQGIGKIPINVNDLGIDMLCASGHKLYGPKGVGFLYRREGIRLTPLLHGGNQEKGQRGGTYNSPLIIGLGKACELALINLERHFKHVNVLNDYARERLSKMDNIHIISKKEISSPYILNFIVENFDANVFIDKNKGLAVSNGSACTSSIVEPSHVLVAMGYEKKQCQGAIRISFSYENTRENIDNLLDLIGK
ncbi:cysteine desulfurase family protein [Myroides sp. LJL115]